MGVEHGVFTPLVLSTNGGMIIMGWEAATFFKQLADMHDLPETATPLLDG